MSREIELHGGQVAIVDDADFEWLSCWKWTACERPTGGYYAVRSEHRDGKTVTVRMHREIVGAGKGDEVDHKNRNKLDNRRDNLRLATRGQNARNIGKSKANKSGFKGVHFSSAVNKWCAQITLDYDTRHLGVFESKRAAAAAYNDAATELHGEFAALNDLDSEPDEVLAPQSMSRQGEGVNTAKLSEHDVPLIIRLIDLGWSRRKVGALFGMAHGPVLAIEHGKSWKHVVRTDRSREAAIRDMLGDFTAPSTDGVRWFDGMEQAV